MDSENTVINFSSILGKLKTFDGKTSFKTFINNFNLRANLENWDDDTKIKILKCLCTNNALIYLNTNPRVNELNFNELVTFLESRFTPVINKHEAYSKFTNCKQLNTSVTDYVNKIEEIIESVIDILSEFQDEDNKNQFLISSFINGLNYEIKKLIGVQKFDTYEECINAAHRAEKLIPHRPINVHNVNKREIICYFCNKSGHYKSECHKYLQSIRNKPKNF